MLCIINLCDASGQTKGHRLLTYASQKVFYSVECVHVCSSLYLSNMSSNLPTVIKLNYLNYAPGGEQNVYVIHKKMY